MKWEIIDNTPKMGEGRFVTKFAWWPTRVLSKITMTDHMVWLQLYLEEQEYTIIDTWGEPRAKGWKTIQKTIHT